MTDLAAKPSRILRSVNRVVCAQLQSKIKVYKQQVEEVEEIAALNLAKFRNAQQELEELEEVEVELAVLI